MALRPTKPCSITIHAQIYYDYSYLVIRLSHLGKKYILYFPIHRGALLHDYFQIQIHEDELQSSILIDEIVSGFALSFLFASLCQSDCSTLTALSMTFMVICSHPFLPPLFPRQYL